MHRPRLHRYYAKLRYSFGFEFRFGFGVCPLSHFHGRSWYCSACFGLLVAPRRRGAPASEEPRSPGAERSWGTVTWTPFRRLFSPVGPAEDAHLSLFTFAEMHRSLGVLSTSHPGHDGDSTDVLFLALALPQTPG